MPKTKIKAPLFTILPPCAPLQPQHKERGTARLKVVYWIVTTHGMLGWTQKELAEYLGVSCRAVFRCEHSMTSMPAETFLEMIPLRKRIEKHLKNNHRPVGVYALAKGWKRETDPVYLLWQEQPALHRMQPPGGLHENERWERLPGS
jgi:hypothetical protein